jgi:hypothetical protein
LALIFQAEHRSLGQNSPDRIGKLNLSPCAGRGFFKRQEDIGRKNIATNNSEVAVCLLLRRFLNHIKYLMKAFYHGARLDDAVLFYIAVGHALNGNDRIAEFIEGVCELPGTWFFEMMRSSGSNTAKGSSLMMLLAHRTAWPGHNGADCRTETM